MSRSLQRIGVAALAPYLVLSQSLFPVAAGSTDFGAKSRMLIAEAKTAGEFSPAVSGVKLLQLIFQQLRKSNQLALNNPAKQLIAANQAFKGSLDPLLAIRPQEKSLNRSNSIAYAPRPSSSFHAHRAAAPKMQLDDSFSASNIGGAGSAAAGSFSNSARSAGLAGSSSANGSAAAPAPLAAGNIKDYSFDKSLPVNAGLNSVNRRVDRAMKTIAKRNSLATDGQKEVMAVPTGSPALSAQNSQMLARSVSNLMQSTRALSALSQQGSDNSVHSFGKAKVDMLDERTIATQPGGPVIQEYGASGRFSAERDLVTPVSASRKADFDSASEQLMTPDQPGQYKYLRNQLLALLPPSVVGGIPLARLGATEQELASTLSKKNGATKQIIDEWTVWTLKGNPERTAAVQLYMRHSVVEAIRVFQPAYLGEEVGIRIGDELSTIKSKYGEPAFILSEPEIGGHSSQSQNYVYPISHVAFQLARSKTQPLPQVVSVLIFEVQ